MVVRTLSLVKKGQTKVHSGCSTQFMQYAVDLVHSGCSIQWTIWNNGIWWWGYCLWCKKVTSLCTVSTAYCIHWIHWFDLFAPKTMSPLPYTTIPLHPLCTVSTASTDFNLFVPKTMSPPPYTTIPLHTVSTTYCIHWFDLFAPNKMSPPPYTTIPLHPLGTGPLHTASTAPTGLTFLHQIQCPHYHIPLFHCIHCILCPLCTASNAFTSLTFLHQRQCLRHHIPLFHSVHCVLHPLHTASNVHCIHCMGWPFCIMVPTTHISWVHCVSWPFCTNAYCMTHCMGWPFCTKGNGPHHPYLLSTLCEFNFLHQHLLHPLCPLRGLTFLH